MRLGIILSLGLVMMGADRLAGQVKEPASTNQVISLEIHKKLPDAHKDMVFAFRDGTALSVMVSQPGKRILDVDATASKLESFTDDKQSVLTKPKGDRPGFGEMWLDGFPRIAADGQHCVITLRAPNVPAAGAAAILVKASIALKIGSDPKTEELKNISLKPGDKAAIGKLSVGMPKENFGGAPTIFISSDQPNVGPVVFLDANGKEIKTQPGGSSRLGLGNKTEYQSHFVFDNKIPDKITVKVTYYTKVESVTVPLDLKTGVGF